MDDEARLRPVESFPATHLHGIGYDWTRDQLYLATHHGLYLLANATETATDIHRVGIIPHDLMGFHIHPHAADTLYASGHPAVGGNLGLIRSMDAGMHWEPIFHGLGDETVDFHAMSISSADPDVIVGAFMGRLHVSEDGGGSFHRESPLGPGLCWGAPCLGLDARERETIWRGDPDALWVSTDLGVNWTQVAPGRHAGVYSHPADGALWAWAHEGGAMRFERDEMGNLTAMQPGPGFEPSGDGHVFQWSGDPGRPDVLFAATLSLQAGVTEVFRTLDGGTSWERVFEA